MFLQIDVLKLEYIFLGIFHINRTSQWPIKILFINNKKYDTTKHVMFSMQRYIFNSRPF